MGNQKDSAEKGAVIRERKELSFPRLKHIAVLNHFERKKRIKETFINNPKLTPKKETISSSIWG